MDWNRNVNLLLSAFVWDGFDQYDPQESDICRFGERHSKLLKLQSLAACCRHARLLVHLRRSGYPRSTSY
jgi:hypothetical protein